MLSKPYLRPRTHTTHAYTHAAGTAQLVINGANFGPSGASVLVGGIACLNTQHASSSSSSSASSAVAAPAAAAAHAQLTCTLPSGRGTALPVVVIQSSGVISATANDTPAVSYLQVRVMHACGAVPCGAGACCLCVHTKQRPTSL